MTCPLITPNDYAKITYHENLHDGGAKFYIEMPDSKEGFYRVTIYFW